MSGARHCWTACSFMVDLLRDKEVQRSPHDQPATDGPVAPWAKPEMFRIRAVVGCRWSILAQNRAPQTRFLVKSSDFAAQTGLLQTRWAARGRRLIVATRDDTRQRHQRGAGRTVAAQSSGV